MAESLPKDVYQGVEAEVRSALGRRIAEADGYAHNRDTMHCATTMTIKKGALVATVTIKVAWAQEDTREMETK